MRGQRTTVRKAYNLYKKKVKALANRHNVPENYVDYQDFKSTFENAEGKTRDIVQNMAEKSIGVSSRGFGLNVKIELTKRGMYYGESMAELRLIHGAPQSRLYQALLAEGMSTEDARDWWTINIIDGSP